MSQINCVCEAVFLVTILMLMVMLMLPAKSMMCAYRAPGHLHTSPSSPLPDNSLQEDDGSGGLTPALRIGPVLSDGAQAWVVCSNGTAAPPGRPPGSYIVL